MKMNTQIFDAQLSKLHSFSIRLLQEKENWETPMTTSTS